jgi:hypothetical protein
MDLWNAETLGAQTFNFETLTPSQQSQFILFMNSHFPPATYERHRDFREYALNNMNNMRKALNGAKQQFPSVVHYESINASPDSLKDHALIFTAGGEGERLRLSLLKQGIPADELENFTKATFYLPDFYNKFGTLHINLAMVSSLCKKFNINIPVIVTTGPKESITARVIPEMLKQYSNFGLKNIRVIEQDERLHLTNDNKIVWQTVDDSVIPVTNPDETGGPLMKLKDRSDTGESILEWLNKIGCTRSIVVQATALYDQRLLPMMASGLKGHDCLAVGILRKSFPEKDPFGTFVTLDYGTSQKTMILEQDVRDVTTRTIVDDKGIHHLPYNTGFYAFENDLLSKNDLPHFATPPKEIQPHIERASKIGYAATDIVPAAKNPVILAMDESMFGVLKTADDLAILSELGKRYGLDNVCKEFDNK